MAFAAASNKYFEYAREVNLYSEQRPQSNLAKVKVVPSYILVGDQSSGKTTLLSRLAGLPLGYTATKTGTRRPFEYNLFHDPSKDVPEVEVNSQKIPEEDLLKVMTEKNGSQGFKHEAVSVKILWKNIKSSMIIADMPGMKDGDDEPERMILERLKHENVIPVVILEPKDFDSKHYAFSLLQKAGRKYKDIIVVVNKCDEKMSETGEWSAGPAWADFWECSQRKGFKQIFFVGWPCSGNRNTTNVKEQKEQLGRSYEDERRHIERWQVQSKAGTETADMLGLEKFQHQLHRDQSDRLHEMHARSNKEVQAELEVISKQLQDMENAKGGYKELSERFSTWSYEVNKILKGEFDESDYTDHCSTAEEDLSWLFDDGRRQFSELDSHDRHREKTAELLKQDLFRIPLLASEGGEPLSQGDARSWIDLIAHSVETVYEPLMGKAALERILDVSLAAALARLFQHTQMEFTTSFIRNIYSAPEDDTGNKVIMRSVEKFLANSLHPLVDVTCLLVWKHLETCFTRSCKEWNNEAAQLKELKIHESYDKAAKAYAKDLVRDLNKALHDQLEAQRFRPQGRCRTGPRSAPLAFNFAGVAALGPDEAEGGYCAAEEDEFCSRFLKMGIQTLTQAGYKCQQARRFYHVLLSSLLPVDSSDKIKIAAARVFPEEPELSDGCVELDAAEGGEREIRSLPLRLRKGHAIVLEFRCGLDVKGEVVKEKSQKLEVNKEGCQPGWWGYKDRRALSIRDSEALEVQAPSVTVSLVDQCKDGTLLASSFDPVKESKVKFEAAELVEHRNKLVHVNVACSGYKLSLLSVGFEHEPEEASPPSSSECASKEEEAAPGEEVTTEGKGLPGSGKEQIQFAKEFLASVKGHFKPLPKTDMAGMRFRKLHADASYELMEQAIFFRDLLEKRLGKLKETVDKHLAHEMTTRVGHDVLEGIEKKRLGACKRLKKHQRILDKALELHREICNPMGTNSDSEGE